MIRELIDNLDPEQRCQLMLAFENGFSQYVELPHGKFLGVNVHATQNLTVEETAGVWMYGGKKDGTGAVG